MIRKRSKLGDDQHVAGLEFVEHTLQFGPPGSNARNLLCKDSLDAGLFQDPPSVSPKSARSLRRGRIHRLPFRTRYPHQIYNILSGIVSLTPKRLLTAANAAIQNVVDVIAQVPDQCRFELADLGDDAVIADVMFRPLRQRRARFQINPQLPTQIQQAIEPWYAPMRVPAANRVGSNDGRPAGAGRGAGDDDDKPDIRTKGGRRLPWALFTP
jgi:hypothetical protein